MKFHFHALGAVTLALSLFITSCSKNKVEDQELPVTLDNETSATAGIQSINSSFSENWNSYTHGNQYTQSQAESDFGNISGWNASRSMISNGNLRITLLPNALSGAGGVISNIDVSDGSEYQVSFTIRFHSAFDWSRGGKLGFGLLIGDGNTGGDPGWDGNGGSFRLMWYNNNGNVYFHPYVYHRDQSGQYGDNFGVKYPSSGSLVKGQTYNVTLYAKSNTGSNTNGRAKLIINGTTVLDRAMRWTTNDSKRLIRRVSFHTFRGGSQSYWMSSTTGYIYYDDLVVTKIN
ncbi:MAG: polysaccharide lyase [Chitinophaga sp.]